MFYDFLLYVLWNTFSKHVDIFIVVRRVNVVYLKERTGDIL